MNNIKNICFDVAKNIAKDQEYIVIYKMDNKYSACSICGDSLELSPISLGEFHHLVQIPTSWILLNNQWESLIDNPKIVNMIWNTINSL